mgnify:CR=1 FL=1
MKIITYQCKSCGNQWQENVQDIYKTGVMKECPVCHGRETRIEKKKIVIDAKEKV